MYKNKRVVGIIAEFNPFHEGHEYLIRAAKEKFQAEYVIIAMSGDFVQRGEPGFFSKYERTEKALKKGADVVLQMPVMFSTASAEDFAHCGVAMLDNCGIVDYLCFGSETGDADALQGMADFLLKEDKRGEAEPSPFSDALKSALRDGLSFPAARERAMREALTDVRLSFTANDILGVEYLKAIRMLDAKLLPGVIPRDLRLRSAHSIRDDIIESCGRECSHPCFCEPDMLSDMLSYSLLLHNERNGYRVFSDVSEELSRGIEKQLWEKMSFRSRIERLKSKNLTYARISRALIHILLNIKAADVELARKNGYVRFHRVLGVSKAGRELLGSLRLPVLASPAKWNAAESDTLGNMLYRQDLFASRIYNQIYCSSYNDFTEKLRII